MLARTSLFMFYPWVQMLKLEEMTPFGPRLARHHAHSMRANDLVPAPSVLFVVESARRERGWTRFELRDPTGMVVAGTRDDSVEAKLVVGAAVKLTNVRLRVNPAFCGRRGITIARENVSRVVAPKKNPGKQHAASISLFKHTTPFSIYESLAQVEKGEVADITYRQFREEWKRRRALDSSASASAAATSDESFSLPSTAPRPQKPQGEESLRDSIGHAADALHHLVEEENDDDDDGGESDLSQPSDLPSSQPSDPVAVQRQTSAKRKFLKRVESDPTLPDSQPPRVDEEEEEQSEAVKRSDAESVVDAERSIGTSTSATATTTTTTTVKSKSKSKAKAKSEGEDELGKQKKKRSRSSREAETKEERIKKHKESEARKKQFVEGILGKAEAKSRKPKQVLTPLVPLTEQARQLLDRCEEQQSQRLSQHKSEMVARTQQGGEGSDNDNDNNDDEASEDELQATQGIYDLADVLTRCRQFKTGALVALVRLKHIRIKAYYIVEKDPVAMAVVRANFPPHKYPFIRFLGCVENITEEVLQDIVQTSGPVDLLIGGSPCNNLSVLGNKEGLEYKEGPSHHFYDFLRHAMAFTPHDGASCKIKRQLRHMCNTDQHKVFFLLENVASMKNKDKETMTNGLGVEPENLDSVAMTKVRRNRYYWHNMPRNIQPLPKTKKFQEHLSQDGEALVSQGGCLTTCNSNNRWDRPYEEIVANLKNIRRYNIIKIKGQKKCRSLKCSEIERILGFPVGHTKMGMDEKGRTFKISEAQRKKLLGQSFDTRVITYLLTPLIKLCKGEEELESRILHIRRQMTLSQMNFVQKLPRPAIDKQIDNKADVAKEEEAEAKAEKDDEDDEDEDDYPLTQAG